MAKLVSDINTPSSWTLEYAILGLLVLTESLVSVFWIFSLSSLGDAYAFMAAFPYAYIVFSYMGLLVLYRLKLFEYFAFMQLAMLLVMPFLMQWVMGGFAASSGVAIWGVLSPVGALMVLGTRKSTPWFLLFALLAAFSWMANDYLAAFAIPFPKKSLKLFFVVNTFGPTVILYLILRYFNLQKENMMHTLDDKNHALLEEQQKSDYLLLNVLPKSVADRLKNSEQHIADSYANVTILFADLVDFTKLSSTLGPAELVDLLNEIFSSFDNLAQKYGLEKIKTIGDAYMMVAGAPLERVDHAQAAAEVSIQMHKALKEFCHDSGYQIQMRIGINSGPVVAGIIGKTKFSYDLWGDAVNVASRMESHCIPNETQVSYSTYQLLKTQYHFEPRGEVDIKGKGTIETYWLKSKVS